MNSQAIRRPYFQTEFSIEEFAERRRRLASQLVKGAAAVLRGTPANGAFEVFRQSNEFFYLSGVEVPHAYLRISGVTGETTLYLPHRNEKLEHSDGPQLNCDTAEVAQALTGVDAVKPLQALAGDLEGAREIHTPLAGSEGRQVCRDTIRIARREGDADPWADAESPEERFARRLSSVCPEAAIIDLSPAIDRMRLLKSPRELELMRRAGALTAQAVIAAMRATRPGMMEYQLAAVADHVYRDGGAQGPGYTAIVASGINIWNAHYNRLNGPLDDGELVLMDYAPDVCYYTSDIGRFWPVNGKFAPWQRELYGFMVEYHKALLGSIRPGLLPDQIMDDVATKMRKVVEATAWSRPTFRAAAEATLKFRGHLSHPVGMAVHDVGKYFSGPLLPGTVFAVDPQLWVPEEEIYVRVEDTVAVTATGIEVLTAGAPIEVAEIEQLLAGT